MWKQRAGALLDVGTRMASGRRVARLATRRGWLPPGAAQFMHIDPAFQVDVDGSSFRYAGDKTDSVGRNLFWSGLSGWENESWREFIPMARKARGFLDIGAFTGCYSIIAATVNPSLRAVAFEPVPGVYDRLVHNIAINDLGGRITPVPAAVSGSDGVDRFFIPDRSMPDTGFLQSSARQTSEAGAWHDVRTTTIASALPSGFHVDLVKIDVEDAEGPVLEAMSEVLDAHRPNVFIEFLDSGSYKQAGAVLADIGYDIFQLTDTGRHLVDSPRPLPGATFYNYLCVPRRPRESE